MEKRSRVKNNKPPKKHYISPAIQSESLFDKEQFTKAAAYGSCNRCATGPAQIC